MALGSVALGSMAGGRSSTDGSGSPKRSATLATAAALVGAARASGYTHAVYVARSVCEPVENGASAPSAWSPIEFDGDGNPGAAFVDGPPRWRPNGIRVVVSDLFFLDDPSRTIEPLARGSAAAYVVQVASAADLNPPDRGNLRVIDYETGESKEVFLDAGAQERYRRKLAAHLESWSDAARQAGASLATLEAEALLETWELGALVEAGILDVS